MPGEPGAPPGAVRLRSNVTFEQDWELVPGEIVARYRPNYFTGKPRRGRQHAEKMYYAPCSRCGRSIREINLEGCEQVGCPSPTPADVKKRRRVYEETLRDVMQGAD
jgi:hypothetical protein